MSRETASMKPVNEITESECRDEIARAKGWRCVTSGWVTHRNPDGYSFELQALPNDPLWHHHEKELAQRHHPIESSLDAAHDSLPDNTNWDDIKRRRHRETDTKWRACVHMKLGMMQSFVVGYGSTMPLAMLRASTAAHRAKKETR